MIKRKKKMEKMKKLKEPPVKYLHLIYNLGDDKDFEKTKTMEFFYSVKGKTHSIRVYL